MRCAIYTRVSTKDKGQECANQILQLREFATKQGWQIVAEYSDQASAKGTNGRHEFVRMFTDAEAKRFDVLLFWSLDRLSREGVVKTLGHLERLTAAGVGYRSFTEQYLDSCGIFKEAVISILATVAKQERLRISERVKAGIARVRKPGDRWGAAPVVDRNAIVTRKSQGMSNRAIAKDLGCSHQTVNRVLSAAL